VNVSLQWRHIFIAWALIFPIILASAVGLDAVTSLRGKNTVWDNVSNPRHDPIAISRAVTDDQDNAQ
jgi:hypothetical protein